MPSPTCVLVVDDDATRRMLVTDALDGEGSAAVTANHGADALVQVATLQPAASVLDLMLPRMDAWALLAACRAEARLAQIPVLVLSAARDLGTLAPTLGVRACLAKPFDAGISVENRLAPGGELLTYQHGSEPRAEGTDAGRPGAGRAMPKQVSQMPPRPAAGRPSAREARSFGERRAAE